MKEYYPHRLMKVAERVRKAHPTRQSSLEKGEDLLDSTVGKLLLRKLRRTDAPSRILSELTGLERRVLGGLLSHPDPVIRKRVIRTADLDATLIGVSKLWFAYQGEVDADLRVELRNVLGGRRELSNLQVSLLEPVNQLGFFRLVLRAGLSLADGYAGAKLLPGPLRAELEQHALESARRDIWQMFDREAFRDLLAGQSDTQAIRTWAIFVRQHAEESAAMLFGDWTVEELFTQIEDRRPLLRRLDQRVAERLHELLNLWQMQRVFNRDNERFKFWNGFASRMHGARADIDDNRLFMDFGRFGIIEFGDHGRAGYIYAQPLFGELVKANFTPPRKPEGYFRDQERAIDRIIHRPGWQSVTRDMLRQMGV